MSTGNTDGSRLPIISIAILIAGWAVGLTIYFSAAADQQLPFELTDDSKRYVDRLEKLGGKSAIVYQQINDFVSSLWHGPRLGITLGVLSSLLALAWFRFAPRDLK